MKLQGAIAACAFALACRGVRPAPPRSDEVESKRLAQLADEYWQLTLQQNPLLATSLGDRRFDDELPDLSEEAHQRALERMRQLKDAAAKLDANALAEPDRVTREVLIDTLDATLGLDVCHLSWWDVNPLDGIQVQLAGVPQAHTIVRADDARSLELRYLKSGVMVDQHIDNLRRGVKGGYSAAKIAVEHVVAQLRLMLEEPADSSSFVTLAQFPKDWREEQLQGVRKHLADAVRSGLKPALGRYLAFLKDEYLEAARTEVGVSANPDGAACYLAEIRSRTGLSLSPKEIHATGLLELEKNERQMKQIAMQVGWTDDVKVATEKLKEDPREHVGSPRELLEFDRAVIERAEAALPKLLGHRPARHVQIKVIEPYREKDSPPGFYEEGAWDGTRPGYYYINTYQTPQRLLFQREALAFHEAVPGHHVQLQLTQETRGLPAFRRGVYQTAFVEGWAHYAELLADEEGLYSGPEARFGMLSDQALRAARLVVDTGVHAKGWRREEAIQFLIDHTAEPPDECTREVDRYIVWPAQAVAYKLGQLEILELREEARQALGERFDLRAFHDALLANGGVPMPVMRRVVKQWIAAHAVPGASGPAVAR